jgi:hypothetical protein
MYTAMDTPLDGAWANKWMFRCDQCQVVADVMTRPFPHQPGCPMLIRYYTTKDGVTTCNTCGKQTSSFSSASFPHSRDCSVLALIRKNLQR